MSVYDLDDPSIFEYMQKLSMDGIRLFAEYWKIYVNAYQKLSFVDYFDKVYDAWLYITDIEFDKQLRTERFIKTLNEYVENSIELHKAMERMGYPVSLINDLIDQYLRGIMVFSNIPVRPYHTAHEIVRRKDDTRLLRYKSSSKYKTPLLIVYAPVNRYHIMDLNDERSIVKCFVRGEFDVFLLDWGEQRNNNLTISDYVNYIDESVREIKRLTGSDKVSLFGYCWGGVLSIIYAAIHKENIKNLIVQAAPVDFDKDNSILADWARRFPVDKFVDEFKEMDGHILDVGFLMRNPVKYGFDKYLKFMRKFDDPKFVESFIRVERWLYDTPDIPGEFFRQFIKDLYQRNLLVQNKMNLNGKAVNLKAIDMSLLNIVGVRDDLAPSASSTVLNDIVSSKDKKLIEFPSGHVGLCVSTAAYANLWPQVVKWLRERS
ncbi:MAG: alpha/beta fold hydrolase [Nitrososphaerales archaeon]